MVELFRGVIQLGHGVDMLGDKLNLRLFDLNLINLVLALFAEEFVQLFLLFSLLKQLACFSGFQKLSLFFHLGLFVIPNAV